MSQGDSISRQMQRKDLATRDLVVHIAEKQGKTYDRQFQADLMDQIRYPDWSNSPDHWTYFIDQKVRNSWHHLEDIARLSIYLVVTFKEGQAM